MILRKIIELEAVDASAARITKIDPWDEQLLARTCERIGKEWDALEEAATRAQGTPDFSD